MDPKKEIQDNEIPLSESNVSLRLEDIRKRCSALLEDPDSMISLTLEEPALTPDDNNPYNRG